MANPICPTNCTSPLPIVSFSDCNPEVHLSEIEYLLLAKAAANDITDMTSVTEWSTRISNTATDANAIRKLRVSGEMPASQESEIGISGQRKVVIDRSFSITAEIDELNQQNYDAAREMQCGGFYKVWPVTRSGHIFGGKTGIVMYVKSNLALGKGENDIQKINISTSWKTKFMPERHVWPLAV